MVFRSASSYYQLASSSSRMMCSGFAALSRSEHNGQILSESSRSLRLCVTRRCSPASLLLLVSCPNEELVPVSLFIRIIMRQANTNMGVTITTKNARQLNEQAGGREWLLLEGR